MTRSQRIRLPELSARVGPALPAFQRSVLEAVLHGPRPRRAGQAHVPRRAPADRRRAAG